MAEPFPARDVTGAGQPAAPPATEDTLTVLYDGACPLCQREISHLRGLAQRQDGIALCFVDIRGGDDAVALPPAERAALLA